MRVANGIRKASRDREVRGGRLACECKSYMAWILCHSVAWSFLRRLRELKDRKTPSGGELPTSLSDLIVGHFECHEVHGDTPRRLRHVLGTHASWLCGKDI